MVIIPGVWNTDTPLRGQGSTMDSSVQGHWNYSESSCSGKLFFPPETIEEIKQQQQGRVNKKAWCRIETFQKRRPKYLLIAGEISSCRNAEWFQLVKGQTTEISGA